MNIQDAYTDFILSREAKNVTKRTLDFYRFNLTKFTNFLGEIDLSHVDQLKAKHVRLFLKKLRDRDLSDSYIHSYARAIKTFVRFIYREGYIEKKIIFDMPKIAPKKLRVLSIKEIEKVVQACDTLRDKLIVYLCVDTGVRLSELCKINWGDLNIDAGSIIIREGKGRKFRVVGVGIKTRRMLLKYKSQIEFDKPIEDTPLIQTYSGDRFSSMGMRSVFVRLAEKSGIDFSAHALRRSFAKLSVKAGMNLIYLQSLMGHSHIDTTRSYVQKLDDTEIINAHKEHGTVDSFFR
jgi:integrase/recombinase XerD